MAIRERDGGFGFILLVGVLLLSALPCASHLSGVHHPGQVALLAAAGALHAFFLAAAWALFAAAASRLGRAGRALAIALCGPYLLYVAADSWAFGLVGAHLGRNNVGHLFQVGALWTLGLTWIDLALALLFLALGCLLGFYASMGLPADWRRLGAGALAAELVVMLCASGVRAIRAEPYAGLADAVPMLWRPHPGRWFARRVASVVDDDLEFPSPPEPPSEGRSLAKEQPATGLGSRPDVFLVVVESLRADALAAMPHVSALAESSVVGLSHYSPANCTHLSMFSLLTGLDASYWAAQGTRESPVGMHAFDAAGYQVVFKESMALNFDLADKILPHGEADVVPTPPMDPIDRDDGNIRWAEEWVRSPHARPTFTILFLDASHWPYWIEGDHSLEPDAFYIWEDGKAVRAVHERYLRSIRDADDRIERVVDALRAAGRWDRTAFVVTGDHGEAFREHGVLMHGSRLDDEQIRVPLLMHLPGERPRSLSGPSIHQDVLPTLLGWLGARLPQGPGMGADLWHGEPRSAPPLVAACGTEIPQGYAALVGRDKVLLEIGPHGASLVGVVGPEGELLAGPQISFDREVRQSFSAATSLLAPLPGG